MALACNFCGKEQQDIWFLVKGLDAYICDECIDLCCEILSENLAFVQRKVDMLVGPDCDW